MRTRLIRTLAFVTGLAVCGVFMPAPAGAAVQRAPLTDEYCNAFSDFYTVSIIIEFSVALFEAFSQVPDESTEPADDDEIPDSDQLRASYYALLSPKMVGVSEQLAEKGPKVLRPLFRQQSDVFARGVELLRDAGLPEEQIEQIAEADISSSTAEVSELTGEVELDDEAIETLANTFLTELGSLDEIDLSEKANRALDRSASECGVVPNDDYDCDDLLPAAEAEAILGDEVTPGDDGCAYSGPEPVDGLTPEIEVLVYDSARALDFLTRSVEEVEEVSGIGDEAVAIEGFSTDGRGISCGRTLHVVDGDRTVVVALCLGGDDPPVSNDQVAQVAAFVLERLG